MILMIEATDVLSLNITIKKTFKPQFKSKLGGSTVRKILGFLLPSWKQVQLVKNQCRCTENYRFDFVQVNSTGPKSHCTLEHALCFSGRQHEQFDSFYHLPSRPAHCDPRVSRHSMQVSSVKCPHRATQFPFLSTIAPFICSPISEQRNKARLASPFSTLSFPSVSFLCLISRLNPKRRGKCYPFPLLCSICFCIAVRV
jgi:hypothetical protein